MAAKNEGFILDGAILSAIIFSLKKEVTI